MRESVGVLESELFLAKPFISVKAVISRETKLKF